MIELSAEIAARALGEDTVSAPVTGISTDTRTLVKGDLFIALRGDNYDGNQFVPAALAGGAGAAVVELGAAIAGEVDYLPPGGQTLHRVPDTLAALAALAREVRRASTATVVAITGSVGKTSTKDLVSGMAAVVRRVVATSANENNEIGVSLTLLEITPETEVVVVEMGMRGKGQIRSLTLTAEPDVAVITAIAPVHLELIGRMEDVLAAKAEIFEGVRAGGAAVVPVDAFELAAAARLSGVRVVTFDFTDARAASPEIGPDLSEARSLAADVVGVARRDGNGGALLRLTWPGGEAEVGTAFRAAHRLRNAVAATAACYAAGLPVAECVSGLSSVDFTPLRGDEVLAGGVLIVDDTYNANPVAVRLALDDLAISAESGGRRPIAVLGDMLELGPHADEYHREVGRHAARTGVAALFGVGPRSRHTIQGFRESLRDRLEPLAGMQPGVWSETADAAVDGIVAYLRPGDVVLVKGSRGMKLDRLVERLVARLEHERCSDEVGGAR
ncbi:MAG TPA: UDP-N-acetylmuramoyl-tripeptide--D-alanyl-D-alanine ligase [Thermoleophilia bacterium]|nr:UDP-N-acetylmuramoyl-tripeptide--D-alanyl-D-alanine ligase [Thermoleophilia bacterium]